MGGTAERPGPQHSGSPGHPHCRCGHIIETFCLHGHGSFRADRGPNVIQFAAVISISLADLQNSAGPSSRISKKRLKAEQSRGPSEAEGPAYQFSCSRTYATTLNWPPRPPNCTHPPGWGPSLPAYAPRLHPPFGCSEDTATAASLAADLNACEAVPCCAGSRHVLTATCAWSARPCLLWPTSPVAPLN
jgi:hypothetical protein